MTKNSIKFNTSGISRWYICLLKFFPIGENPINVINTGSFCFRQVCVEYHRTLIVIKKDVVLCNTLDIIQILSISLCNRIL